MWLLQKFNRHRASYLVYYPDARTVLKRRLVKFVTKSVVEHETQTDLTIADDDFNGKKD